MKKNNLKKIALFSSLVVFISFTYIRENWRVNPIIPVGWPKPVYDFNKNPLSTAKIELGRKLFYDPILSLDNTISCASCHLSYTAFTHVDHALSHGINDSVGTRNSPVLINLAWNKHFMWDGAINHIEVQALAPITHPAEMGEDIGHVINKLQGSSLYPKLFLRAFGDSIIKSSYLLKAMAQFQLTLISADSKYDKVQSGELSFTEQEHQGYTLFKQNCASCHQEPLFTTGSFERNGLPIDSTLLDYGRFQISKNPSDSFKFKIPTLRNIEFSKPYMHDGRFKTLNQVMNHYSNNHALNLSLKALSKNEIRLSSRDKVDLIAFLLTLSDKAFLFNPDFAYPRN